MKYALIFEGRIVDVAALPFDVHESMSWVPCPDDCTMSTHEYVDGVVREKVIEPEPPAVPQVISRFQGIAQLHKAGLLDQVNAIMADPATDPLTVIAWNTVQEFRRQSPIILAMAPLLELTDEDLDQLFTLAAGIEG
ncbi:hypothetical protein [Herminiimonas contaminans]|uniref:Protein required for attachment to host cells n=1 Tax=Herminiimonas contaminans TaxID=1111140 RepID=A0ABS0ESI4_9BURK|nr:hypothetical protein [Herminiimonas contaminans]MBF8177801.1 hypothetical protein [Herminiimonas contaminans]